MGMSISIVAGMAHLGWRLARHVYVPRPSARQVAAGFVVVTALVASLTNGLLVAGLARTGVLRGMALGLAVAGLFEVVTQGKGRAGELWRVWRGTWAESNAVSKAGLVAASSAALVILLAALGPPTDADSLSYHLGVPRQWLEIGAGGVQPYWLHARLVGLGESLNLLGLAGGTDTLGAALQASGLVVAIVTIWSIATSNSNRVLGLLLVLSPPVLLFLVPNQKPQMLPAAALFLALVLLVVEAGDGSTDAWPAWPAWTAIAFAMASKYSFILTGGVVGVAGTWVAWRSGRLKRALGVAALVVAIVAGPVWARNAVVFGDPFSPSLERLKAHPDPVVLDFARFLRSYGSDEAVAGRLQAASRSVASLNPASASSILGVGVLALLLAVPSAGPATVFLACSAAATALIIALGQVSARFLFEPYLWAAGAVVLAGESRRRFWTMVATALLAAQTGLVAVMGGFGAARLFPGALSRELRQGVMRAAAFGYAESEWLDGMLPRGAGVLALGIRSYALVPGPVVVYEPGPGVQSKASARDLCALVRANGTRFVVVQVPVTDDAVSHLLAKATPYGAPRVFRTATRNPSAAGPPYSLAVYELNDGCDGDDR